MSRVGFCATEFDGDIATVDDLVAALKAGDFAARSFRPDRVKEGADGPN